MPNLQLDDPGLAVNDIEVIGELERVMAEWCAALTEVTQREADKHPTGSGPLAGLQSQSISHVPSTSIEWYLLPSPVPVISA